MAWVGGHAALTIQNVQSSLDSSFLATGAPGGNSAQPVDSFAQELFQALSSSLSQMGFAGGQIQVNVQPAGGQITDALAGMRQFLVTVTPGAAPEPTLEVETPPAAMPATPPSNPYLNFAPFGGVSPWATSVKGPMSDPATGNTVLFDYTRNGPNQAFITREAADMLASTFGGTVIDDPDSDYGAPMYNIGFPGGYMAAAGQLAFMLARGDSADMLREGIRAGQAEKLGFAS